MGLSASEHLCKDRTMADKTRKAFRYQAHGRQSVLEPETDPLGDEQPQDELDRFPTPQQGGTVHQRNVLLGTQPSREDI